MNWQQPRKLAEALRDQGLADLIAARFSLRADAPMVCGRVTNLAHVVVAKCQQSVEKVTKGFRLWHDASFSPETGHAPFTAALAGEGAAASEIRLLCRSLNRLNSRLVQEIKWLESLAPQSPDVPQEQRGDRARLQLIQENSEYPYWSTARNELVIPAEALVMHTHARGAIHVVRTFLEALARSEPEAFTSPIRSFLEEHPISKSVAALRSPDVL